MRSKLIIVFGVVAIVVLSVVVYFATRPDEAATPDDTGVFERPMPWSDTSDSRRGSIDPATAQFTVGGISLSAPQPAGVQVSWKHETAGQRDILRGTAEFAGRPAKLEWAAAHGNPHTVFRGELTATRAELVDGVSSVFELPDGEVSYVDATLARVPFAQAPIELSGLTRGPIIWRNGDDVVALWQWNADRLALVPTEDGGLQIQVHWWDPVRHEVPERCAEKVGAMEHTLKPEITISFGEVPRFARGRLPGGVTSAVVPVFVDPHDAEDARFQDGASGSAKDFVKRARTIAFGHSSTTDARYGNGGLAGLDVGGTIVVPPMYDLEAEVFEELVGTTQAAKIELVQQTELRPDDCDALIAAIGASRRTLLGSARTFDGKFPNLFAQHQREAIPGFTGGTPMWHPTALTGRRKDVVTQALSSTYLTRLADVRGLALLEIPIVATRNPLVAVAAEALLEPERNGEWTIEESVARALAGVELLSEDDRFDFIGLQRFAGYTAGAHEVEFEYQGGGAWTVFNGGAELEGFTVVLDGEVGAKVDGSPVASATRTLGNGARQTWIWWDLAAGAPYELQLEGAVSPRPVEWHLAE